jgi:hypothetical protein
MGHPQLSDLLFQIRLDAFEICETIVFIAFAVALAFHTIKLIVDFGRRGSGRSLGAGRRED